MKLVLEVMVHWTTRTIGRVSVVSNLFLQASSDDCTPRSRSRADSPRYNGTTAPTATVTKHVASDLWAQNGFGLKTKYWHFQYVQHLQSVRVLRDSHEAVGNGKGFSLRQLVSKLSEWPWTLQSKHIGSPVGDGKSLRVKREKKTGQKKSTTTMRTTTTGQPSLSLSSAPLEFISTYGTLPVMGFPLNHECVKDIKYHTGLFKAFWILNIYKCCYDASIPQFFHLCQPRAIFQTIWHHWKNAPGNVLGNAASEQLSICSQIVIEMEMLNLVKYQCTSFHITPLGVWGVRPGITQNNIPMAVTTTTTFSMIIDWKKL